MSCKQFKLGDEPAITLVVYDKNTGQPFDISSASALVMHFEHEDSTDDDTNTATLATDGTDGKMQYQVTGSEFKVGKWRVEGVATINGKDIKTTTSEFEVVPSLTDA